MTSIIDVAAELKLSVSTVSRALNSKYGVNQQTRERVLEAAQRLGYVPNLTAKDLVNKKSNLVSILMPVTDIETPPPLIRWFPAIGHTLQSHGLSVIVQFVDPAAYRRGDLLQLCKLRNTEGLIIMQAFGPAHPLYEDVVGSSIPAVVIAENVVGPKCSSIGTDETVGGYLAARHLISLGHKHIAFITGFEGATFNRDRVAGYIKAHEEFSVPLRADYLVHTDLTGKSAAIQARRMTSDCESLTALMFVNDIMAMSALSALTADGYRIPDQYSIVGYDAMLVGEYTFPRLTSIQHDSDLGSQAAELLLELIDGGIGHEKRIAPTLVSRESVARI